MSRTVQAIVFTDTNRVDVRDVAVIEPRPDQLVVATRFSMISTGTELRVLGGHYGAAGKYPLVPGYSYIGQVIDVGQGGTGFQVGDWVAGGSDTGSTRDVTAQWGGHMSAHHVNTDKVLLLPEGGTPLNYVITEIGAISARGVAFANPQPGETAVVIGQGLIGALSAAQLTAAGCRVTVVDTDVRRLERAKQWSAVQINANDPDYVSVIRGQMPQYADIVVESAGNNRALTAAFEIIRRDCDWSSTPASFPRLVLQANYVKDISLNFNTMIPGEGLHIFTPMDRRAQDRKKVIELIANGSLRAEWFIDAVLDYRRAPETYAALRDDPGERFSTIFTW